MEGRRAPSLLSVIGRDGRLLFATRILRLFAYGSLSIVLALYLSSLGFDAGRIGLLLSLTLAGDTLISLLITTRADRFGRRRMLVAGAVLMALAGLVFALSRDYWVLLAAATLGVISPSGNEVGPFLPIEQSALAGLAGSERRTSLFAWYNLAGSFATAAGALAGGLALSLIGRGALGEAGAYRIIVTSYAILGLVLALLFLRLSASIETLPVPAATATEAATGAAGSATAPRTFLGLGESRSVVGRLSALFFMDAFGGGFVIQSFMAYWFHLRFGADGATLGALFFGANILAGLSALSAARIAGRIGLVNTMVFTHLPSNILLVLVPLMPTLPLALLVLLLRFAISQMDVPTRQSYTMAVVAPAERSAAAGVTGVVRTTGAAISPMITGAIMAGAGPAGLPFFLAGGIKIVYDLLLWRSFSGSGAGGGGGARKEG